MLPGIGAQRAGEGAVEGEPAVGVGEMEGAVGVAGDGPAELVDEVVVVGWQNRARSSRLVVPPWLHGVRWWAVAQAAGAPQPGPRQPRSRASSARRSAGGSVRAVRPTPRGGRRASGSRRPARRSPGRGPGGRSAWCRARSAPAARPRPARRTPARTTCATPGRVPRHRGPVPRPREPPGLPGRPPLPARAGAAAVLGAGRACRAWRPVRPAPATGRRRGPGGVLDGGLARVSSLTRMLMCGAAPCRPARCRRPGRPCRRRSGRPSAAAPRCGCPRPPGGPNTSAAVRMISSDTASPQLPDSMPAPSSVSPNDRCRLSQRRFSRSSAASGSARAATSSANCAEPGGIQPRRVIQQHLLGLGGGPRVARPPCRTITCA